VFRVKGAALPTSIEDDPDGDLHIHVELGAAVDRLGPVTAAQQVPEILVAALAARRARVRDANPEAAERARRSMIETARTNKRSILVA
jgi:hypothetical protein